MTYLTDEERAAIQALSPLARGSRVKRAEALINPSSGLANDYLNLFNEIVMLIEQLPMMLELYDDIQKWRPTSYMDYFRRSILPGSGTAIENYERLDVRFRKNFEAVVDDLDRRSTGGVAAVRRHMRTVGEADLEALAVICERAGANIREALDKATMLVNHGEIVYDDAVQKRTDLLLAKLSRSAA